jgi:hypothetical protein
MSKRARFSRTATRVMALLVLGLVTVLVLPLGAMAATSGTEPSDTADYPPPVPPEELIDQDVVIEEEEAEVRGVVMEQPPPAVGALPVTGGQLAGLLALGLTLVAVGALAVRATQRRSTVPGPRGDG